MSLKKIVTIILAMIVTLFINLPISNAAGLTISFSKSNANVGEKIAVTVKGSGIAGKISLTASGNAALSQNSVWVDNSSATVNVTVKGEGDIRITATPVDAADSTTAAPFTTATGGTIKVTSASSGNDGETTATPSPETQKKSSNASLSNLGINPNDFTGFKSGTTVYNVEVPEDVAEIEVYAKAQHAKAKISGTGKKSLQPGANACSVVVTAEDGTKKTYTINVTRKATEKDEEDSKKEETDTTENELEQEKGLSELKIDGLTLSPNFDTSVYEYKVKYIGEETKLKIDTKATQDDYVIDVTGNEELKEGENIITILVSDKDGNNVATYQVTVNKSLVDEEAIAREEAKKQEEFRKKVIIGAVAAVIVVAIIIFFIIRHKRYQRFAEEYSEVPFSGLNDEDNWGKNNNQNWEENNQGTTQEEFSSEKLSREELKSQYLNDYNSNGSQDDFYENETPRRSRHKGKRFK